MRREPPAWGKKYSVVPVQVDGVWGEKRRGMKLIILISRVAHIRNQLVVFRAISVEVKRAVKKRKRRLLSEKDGLKVIAI